MDNYTEQAIRDNMILCWSEFLWYDSMVTNLANSASTESLKYLLRKYQISFENANRATDLYNLCQDEPRGRGRGHLRLVYSAPRTRF